jgi:hypothetical protein
MKYPATFFASPPWRMRSACRTYHPLESGRQPYLVLAESDGSEPRPVGHHFESDGQQHCRQTRARKPGLVRGERAGGNENPPSKVAIGVRSRGSTAASSGD